MNRTHVAVTGTKEGLTAPQRLALFRASKALMQTCVLPLALHHGDCIGADAEMHDIAAELGWYIIIHPPILQKYQAFKIGDESRSPGPYLERNKDLVNESSVLFACPKNMFEETRSGTWHAIRYARSKHYKIYYFWPDGSVTMKHH